MKQARNIFIIDDDEIFIFLTKKMIKSTDLLVQIKTFADGEEAIDYMKIIANNKELLPDIILLDLNMPILDGWGFLEEFELLEYKIEKSISIYISSSSISPFDVERAKSNSLVSDFLIKPYGENKIKEIVQDAVNRAISA
jgi:CheY-like chemotaxis protein